MRSRILICLTVLAAGCGGDEPASEKPRAAATPTAETAKTMPADEWSRQVSEMCDENANQAEREVLKIQQEGGSQEEMVARTLERSAELSEPFIEEMAALPPPQGKEDQAQRFVAAMRDILPKVQESADALRANDKDASLRASQELLKAAVPARELARDLNIHACIPRNAG